MARSGKSLYVQPRVAALQIFPLQRSASTIPFDHLLFFPHCSSAGRDEAVEINRWIEIQSLDMTAGNRTKEQGSQWIS